MKTFWSALRLFLWMTLLTGFAYPLLITAIARLTMHDESTGNFISHEGRSIGSLLIGQPFEKETFFWGRPSFVNYNPLPSSGSNLGPTSAKLKKVIEERKKKLSDIYGTLEIPEELLTCSASGLDPHISLRAARFQIERVSKARGLSKEFLEQLIQKHVQGPVLLAEPYVNVLKLNLELEKKREDHGR